LSAAHVDTIAVPKVHSAADLHFVNDVIRHLRPDKDINILALIESARAITDLSSICSSTPLLSGLVFASEDFALDLSITRTPSLTEFLYARSHIVAAARAHNLPSTIDLVCTSFRGLEGQASMEAECIGGKTLGFTGKQCIHPSQVETAQRVFSPTWDELEWATRVVISNMKAEQQGRGAWALAGKMVDIPVVRKAMVLLEKAVMCGMKVDGLRAKWKNQEPE
jgi:citrate lyase subunit beta-like protein